MKFNKQLSNGGLFLPSAALKISGFEDSGQVEIHALKNTAVIMKQQMTAMELIQALDSLNQLFINLSFHLAKTCGACSGCEGECPFGDFEYDKIELDDDLRKEAGIPTDAKLSLYVDEEDHTITVCEALVAERSAKMSKVHTSVKIRKDGSLVLPAFVMRGMGYAPGEEVPITTPADQYICDCDANSLLVSRVCGDAGCAGYTSEEPELNLPADLLAEASIPVGEEITVLVADGALLIVPTTEDLLELPVELCCLLNELGISPLSIQLPNKCCLP